MMYPALLPLLPLMRTPRLPVVDWIDAPADLNWLARFAERQSGFCACAITFQKKSTCNEAIIQYTALFFFSQEIAAGRFVCIVAVAWPRVKWPILVRVLWILVLTSSFVFRIKWSSYYGP